MLLHIINLFYNFVVYNLIAYNLIGGVTKSIYKYRKINAEGIEC